jgi:transposase-like protein
MSNTTNDILASPPERRLWTVNDLVLYFSIKSVSELIGVVSDFGYEHTFDQGFRRVTPSPHNGYMKTTIASLSREIVTEADAYLYLENLRWNGGARCPKCASTDVHYVTPSNGVSRTSARGTQSERRVWQCNPCRKQFSVLTGTIMHATKISVRTWVLVMFEMCASKNGVAAREIERKYGLNPRTAWHMLHRIREAMSHDDASLFSGNVVADEVYIGGNPAFRHADKRGPRYSHEKTPVVTLIDEETREARSTVVPFVDSKGLGDVIRANVDMATTTLHTDSFSSYVPVGRKMAGHYRVDHSAGIYATDKTNGTNLCENYFAQLKRGLKGTHIHVDEKHLHRYLGEFDYRYSTCDLSDTQRLSDLGTRLEGRLSYEMAKA